LRCEGKGGPKVLSTIENVLYSRPQVAVVKFSQVSDATPQSTDLAPHKSDPPPIMCDSGPNLRRGRAKACYRAYIKEHVIDTGNYCLVKVSM